MSYKRNRKVRSYNDQEIIKALLASHGLVSHAARRLKCTPGTIQNHIKNNTEVAAACQQARDTMLDFTESKLFESIKGGDLHAIIFYLKTQGKSRNYIERQELTGKDGAPVSPVADKLDLSKISLDILEALAKRR
jgi:hypothetical protein